MAYAAKIHNVIGNLAKEEAVSGVAESLSTSADAIQPWFTDRSGIPVSMSYLYEGRLGPAPGVEGMLRPVAPLGGAVQWEMPFFFKGGGAAYSSSVFPLLHRYWKASGHTAVLDATGGAEKWTYTPTAVGTAPTTLTNELYTDGEKIPVIGVHGNWKFSGDTSSLLKHTFSLQGIKGTIADSAPTVPGAFTYSLLSVVPPSPMGSTLLIGSYLSAIGVKSVDWDSGRMLEARPGLDAADAHLGFTHRGREPKLTVVVEATAFVGTPFHTSAGLDPYELYEASNSFACSFQHAGAQYNRFKLVVNQATLVEPPAQERVGGVSCWRLVIGPYCSTPIANDDYNILVN